MAQNSNPLPLSSAENIARGLLQFMEPYCDKIVIAGSIRRRKPQVNDVEIVAAPKWTLEPDPTDLFDERKIRVNLLYREWAAACISVAGDPSKISPRGESRPEFAPVRWIKTGTTERIPWDIAPDGKYWKGYVRAANCNLDLFLTTPENFGAQLLIRTGAAEFSTSVMVHAHRVGYVFDDGFLWRETSYSGEREQIATYSEEDVFRELNLRYVTPEDRVSRHAVISGWEGGPDGAR